MPRDPRFAPENLGTTAGYHLNPHLVARQNVDQGGIDRLKALHAEMHATKERFREVEGPEAVRALVADVARIEYLMQDAWGFRRSASRHTHWRMVPGCTCPYRENEALLGTGHRVIANDCPIHSSAHANDAQVTLDATAAPVLGRGPALIGKPN